MELESSIMDNEHACPVVKREMKLSLCHRAICFIFILEKSVKQQAVSVTCRRTKYHSKFFLNKK